jgi:hypothetical protein
MDTDFDGYADLTISVCSRLYRQPYPFSQHIVNQHLLLRRQYVPALPYKHLDKRIGLNGNNHNMLCSNKNYQ